MRILRIGFLLVVLMIVLVVLAISACVTTPKKNLDYASEGIKAVLYLKEQHLTKQSFDDVPPDHWAYDEIGLIYSYGITVGCSYDPPLYCPDRPMTRAEAAVFAARLIELMEDK